MAAEARVVIDGGGVRLAERLMLNLGDRLVVPAPVNEGQRFLVVGKSGMGKTTTLRLLAKEMIAAGWTVAIIDPANAYRALRAAGLPVLVAGERESADLRINADNAAEVAEFSFKKRHSIALAVNWADDGMATLQSFLERLWEQIYAQPEDGPFTPYALFIDEARLYVPQNGKTPVTDIIVRMAQMGRQWHLTMAIATQRPANVQKDFITQANMTIVHGLRSVDVSPIQSEISIPEKDARKLLRKLPKGRALVFGDVEVIGDPEEEYLLTQIHPWATDGAAVQPVMVSGAKPIDTKALEKLRLSMKAAEAARPVEKTPDKIEAENVLLSQIREALATTNRAIESQKQDILRLQQQIDELRKPPVPAPVTQHSAPLPTIKPVVVPASAPVVPSNWDGRTELSTTRARNRQQREYEAVLADINRFTKQQRVVLTYLTQREGLVIDEKALAYNTGYSLPAMRIKPLVDAGWIKRTLNSNHTLYLYQSNVRSRFKTMFQDLDMDDLMKPILKLERV